MMMETTVHRCTLHNPVPGLLCATRPARCRLPDVQVHRPLLRIASASITPEASWVIDWH